MRTNLAASFRVFEVPVATLCAAISTLALAGCTGLIDGTGGGAPGATGAAAAANSTGTGPATGSGGAGSAPPGVLYVPYARLTRPEYQATIRAAFGVDADISGIPDDSRIGPFTSNIAVSPDPAEPYLLASEDLAALLIPAKLAACTAATASTCIPQTYQKPIEQLYRRSLSVNELKSLSDMLASLEKAGVTSENATRAMITSALLSPDFMFRATPLAGDAARAERLAEHLSYALWDAPPDAELAAVGQGAASELGARLRSEAERLGKDARAVPVLARFMAQWLRVDVDVKLADAGYAASPLYLELLGFVQDALVNDVPVTSFVNGTRGFVQKDDFAAYALSPVASTANVGPVTWPATSPRRGIIGEELFMDATRHPDPTRRPIFRGHLVRSSLLCDTIPPPTAELQALAGEVADRTTDQRCAGCHLMMDPVGAAFASVDLDHTGPTPPAVLNNNTELGGSYPDLPTLLDKIAGSDTFANCFSSYILGFFLEQDPTTVDAASVSDLAKVVKSGGGLADVVGQMVVSLEARSKAVVPWCAGP